MSVMFDDDHAPVSSGKPHAKRLGRELAMQYLFRCDMRDEIPSAATFEPFFEQVREEHGLRENRLARKGREYAEQLYQTVALHRETVDEAIARRAEHWDWNRLSLVDRNIMRIAVAEMLYFEDVPPVVSIDEAVEIARDYSGEEAGNFINGVLNGVKDTLKRSPRGEKSGATGKKEDGGVEPES